MKCLLLCSAALLGASLVAQAQVLPVPGGKNPDWVLFGTYKKPYDGPVVELPTTDRMPNAASKSIKSIGNHHYYWDDNRQLAYDWFSKDGILGPLALVNVRVQQQDVVYSYHRRRQGKL
jgi:hypothetical protein